MLRRLAIALAERSRSSKWHHYRRVFPPMAGEQILDVGVSVHDDLPGENYFLRLYPFADQLVALGIDDVGSLRQRYPGVTFVQADGRAIPYPDQAFDVVHSNATLEHVGERDEQRRFVSELVRVAPAGFVTTPNRLFPFELHARLPFVHWLPRRWMLRAFRLSGYTSTNVWLLTPRAFQGLFPDTVRTRMIYGFLAATTIIIFESVEAERSRLDA